ncbi:MAG: hypothetical protein KC432_01730 [Thermomicrobiales bacterium]|nr:hypothetical protein [Thermomicrobiales bacterium]
MNTNEQQPGLGEIIYSVDDNESPDERKRKQEEVTEADIETFPASDPPSYSGAIAEADSSVVTSGGKPER